MYSLPVPELSEQEYLVKAIHPNLVDDLVFECMVVRATLGSFWSCALKTIGNHIQEVRNMVRYGKMFGYPPMPVLEEIARACSDTRIRPSLTLVLTGPNGQINGLEVTAFY